MRVSGRVVLVSCMVCGVPARPTVCLHTQNKVVCAAVDGWVDGAWELCLVRVASLGGVGLRVCWAPGVDWGRAGCCGCFVLVRCLAADAVLCGYGPLSAVPVVVVLLLCAGHRGLSCCSLFMPRLLCA